MSQSIKGIIKPSELAPFQKAKNLLNLSITLSLYLIVFILIYINSSYPSTVLTFIYMLISAVIQHTLATFIHESAHGLTFSNKNFNDNFGHFFYAAPLFSYLEDYRYFHWEHHRFTGRIDKDPELMLYRSMGVKPSYSKRKEIIQLFLMTIFGITAVKGLIFLNKFYMSKRLSGEIKKPAAFEHLSLFFWSAIIPWLFWRNGLLISYIVIWIIPMFTIFTTLLMWHGLGEHIREKDCDLGQNTFTHHFNFLSTIILYPINSSYHLEHHLFPQLPWYGLKKFRKWAEKNTKYKKIADQLLVKSYFFGKQSILNLSFPIEKNESIE